MRRETIESIIAALQDGRVPEVSSDDIPCFSSAATQGNPHVSPETLQQAVRSWGAQDIPTFQRALRAMDEGDLAWLGFKTVFDAKAAQANVDNEVTKKYGDVGSADGDELVFFCNDAKEIVASRLYSARDTFQMKDVTRGPSMHNEQFEGLTWCSVPLFDAVKVWLLGASDAASEVSALAHHVGFEVVAVDYDPAYLNEARFPDVRRMLVDSFDNLADIDADAADYVCVLTRGHMFDPQGCLWAVRNSVHYVGMMGCAGKNSTVHDLCIRDGMTEEQWDGIKRPIGLKFGAKTPAELAISIVAELVDVRYRERYSEQARIAHEVDLGRH